MSADLAMGKGIAKLFKANFRGVDDLKSQRMYSFFSLLIQVNLQTRPSKGTESYVLVERSARIELRRGSPFNWL